MTLPPPAPGLTRGLAPSSSGNLQKAPDQVRAEARQ